VIRLSRKWHICTSKVTRNTVWKSIMCQSAGTKGLSKIVSLIVPRLSIELKRHLQI
jgi:hypothetical protein